MSEMLLGVDVGGTFSDLTMPDKKYSEFLKP